jgi:hypothetical protein
MSSYSTENINNIFKRVYTFSGYIAASSVVILFIISVVGVSSFIVAEASQHIKSLKNSEILNRDTVEFYLLRLGKNNSETSAYNIFIEQQIVSLMYWVFAIVVTAAVFQCLIILGLAVIGSRSNTAEMPSAVNSGKSVGNFIMNESTAFMSIAIMLGLAILYTVVFREDFVKNVQPDVNAISEKIKDLSEVIYDNLTTDEQFLKHVVNNNIRECYNIINKQGSRSEKIGSMIFTMSIFNYYKSVSDIRDFDKIKSIFTPNMIRIRSVDPFSYLYHNQKSFITNLFQKAEPYIKKALHNSEKTNAARQNAKSRINDVNRKLANMFAISSIRDGVRTYMVWCCLISLFAVILIGLLYSDKFVRFFIQIKMLSSK